MARRSHRRRRMQKGRPPAASTSRPMAPAVARQRLLAEAKEERNPRLALERFQTALDACRTARDGAAFETGARSMWDVPEGRPYLEALFGAGCSLHRLDRREEAAEQFREVLRLDANDHHFARYWLAAALMDLEEHEEAKRLLDRHEEATAVWRYAQALLAFRLGGDTDDARRLLQEAQRLDAGFVDYLLGEATVDASRPVHFGGDRHETAHAAAALFLPAWRSTSGAASWARRVLKVPLGQGAAELRFPRRELRELPRRRVRWQLGLRPLPQDTDAPQEASSWVVGIVDVDRRTLRHMTVIESELTPEIVWREVLSAFLQPLEGEPYRPARLEVSRADFCRSWKDMLAEVSVRCVWEAEPQPVGQMLDGMAELSQARRLPPLRAGADPREYPRTGDVWQADFFHMPTLISNEEIGVKRPWSVLVLDKQTRFVMTSELLRGEPTPELLDEYLLRTMAHPGLREAMRPAAVEVSDSDCFDFLKPRLGELGIACLLKDELPELYEFCERLASSYGAPEKCALAEGAGVTVEQMEAFYDAAASYFRRAPWKHVPGEIPIKVQCRDFNLGTCYAIVLGRTGVTLGLALYRDWDEVVAMLRGLRDWDEMSAYSVIFDEVAIMAPRDLYLMEREGWPIATPEAHPIVLHLEPGRQPQPPNHEELDYVQSCLGTLPDFVACGRESKTYELDTGGRRIRMRLSWTLPRQ
ncbi:MAG: tetratricopeptide repeat protein [Pirellulales bacterium]|nr:tetratricopeptide repeat protein [Pirellulales bacterium]